MKLRELIRLLDRASDDGASDYEVTINHAPLDEVGVSWTFDGDGNSVGHLHLKTREDDQ